MKLPYTKPLPSADLPEFADRLIFTLTELNRMASVEHDQAMEVNFLIQQFDEDRERYNNLSVDDLLDRKFSLEENINRIYSSSSSFLSEMELSFLNGQLSRANAYLGFKARVLYIPDFETIKSQPDILANLLDIAGEYNN